MNSNFKRYVALIGLISFISGLAYLPITTNFSNSTVRSAEATTNALVNSWWPVDGANVKGTQPFKGVVEGMDISQYSMYWQVDNGQWNEMRDNWDGYPHKEDNVDLSGWSWNAKGLYNITYVAKDKSGNVIGTKNFTISLPVSASAQTNVQITTTAPQTSTQTTSQPSTTQTVTPTPAPTPAPVIATALTLQSWWPTNGAVVQGTQPIKVVISNKDIQTYDLYWKIGEGNLVKFNNNYIDAPHKETLIDFTNWTWLGRGPYDIKLIAKSSDGQIIANGNISIYNGAVSGSSPAPAPAPTTTTTPTPIATTQRTSGNPLSGNTLYVDPNSNAARSVNEWANSRPQDADLMRKIANSSTAKWFGGWNSDISRDVSNYVESASKAGQMPVLVLYNIPGRDCGSYSAGGANGASAYSSWINAIRQAIGNKKATVILEPDALAGLDCLSGGDQNARIDLIKNAVSTLKSGSGTLVYIDAGNSSWQSASTMTDRLNRANINQADGFSLNVSNFYSINEITNFGDALGKALGGKHYVIDTSRNGSGSNGEWCNPSGRSLGSKPTTATSNSLVDAFLWIKAPGESDGNCNGGPSAGVWWPDYALMLSRNAAY